MTTPDYPDFTQGVGLLDQASQVTSYLQPLTANGAGYAVDTSKADSVFLNFTLPNSVAGRKYYLTLSWSELGTTTVTEYLSFHADQSYPFGLHDGSLLIPAKGSSLFLTLLGDDNAVITITVIVSTRIIATPMLNWASNRADRMLNNVPAVSVPAGATTATFYVPPVLRALSVDFVTGSTSSLLTMLGVSLTNGVLAARALGRIQGQTSNVLVNPIQIIGTGLECSMTNNGAAATLLGAVVWDVS